MLLNDLLPSETASRLMTSLADIFGEIVANPEKTAERLKQLASAGEEARAVIAQAESDRRETDKKLADHTTRIANERAEHDRVMADEKKKFAADVATRERQLKAQEGRTAEYLAQAKADSDAAAKLRKDLQARADQIRALAS